MNNKDVHQKSKSDLNNKITKVDPEQTGSRWIKSNDPQLQDKRAKDLRKIRYQDAQNAIRRGKTFTEIC